MIVCKGCGHRPHRGAVCRYPLELFSVPGQPAKRCGCEIVQKKRHKGKTFPRIRRVAACAVKENQWR